MFTQALTGAPSSCLMPNTQLNSEPVLVSLVSLHSFHPEVTPHTHPNLVVGLRRP